MKNLGTARERYTGRAKVPLPQHAVARSNLAARRWHQLLLDYCAARSGAEYVSREVERGAERQDFEIIPSRSLRFSLGLGIVGFLFSLRFNQTAHERASDRNYWRK